MLAELMEQIITSTIFSYTVINLANEIGKIF